MGSNLTDVLIVYLTGFSIIWCFRRLGKLRRVVEIVYRPLVWLGLWHSWSMYAPEIPKATRVVIGGVVLEDDTFVAVEIPGLDDSTGFGRAENLRYITFQYKLMDRKTDYLKPALCESILARWRLATGHREPAGLAVAVELREYEFSSPDPGARNTKRVPVVKTTWREEVAT